jgi:hypothetical protein
VPPAGLEPELRGPECRCSLQPQRQVRLSRAMRHNRLSPAHAHFQISPKILKVMLCSGFLGFRIIHHFPERDSRFTEPTRASVSLPLLDRLGSNSPGKHINS